MIIGATSATSAMALADAKPFVDEGAHVASAARFLASDDSSNGNGMELVADGGTTVI